MNPIDDESMSAADIPFCAGADPVPRPASFNSPPGSCDCHAHVFGPPIEYPYVDERSYTPPNASLDQYRTMLDALGIERGVIVQPSVYGTDNRATLDAVRAGNGRYRAVVVVDDGVTENELETMHAAGARAVRVNLLFRNGMRVSDLVRLTETIAPFGWHLQLLVDVSEFGSVRRVVGDLCVETVFDHMGHLPTSAGVKHPGFRDLLALLREGRSWAKLSGAYRMTAERYPPYHDVTPFAESLVAANADRLLWGSDWPHPAVALPMPNDGALLDLLGTWVPDPDVRERILVTNPYRLYGFNKPL